MFALGAGLEPGGGGMASPRSLKELTDVLPAARMSSCLDAAGRAEQTMHAGQKKHKKKPRGGLKVSDEAMGGACRDGEKKEEVERMSSFRVKPAYLSVG